MSLSSDLYKVARVVLGLVIAGISAYAGYRFINQSPIDRHLVYFAGGGVFLGGLIIAPSTFYEAAKKFVALLPSVRIGADK